MDMLALFAEALDTKGTYRGEVRFVLTTLNTNNSYCQGAAQQSANGAYRAVELLNVLVKLFDENGSKKWQTSSIIDLMNSNDRYCQGAPQQMANGAYRIVDMLQVIVDLKLPQIKGLVDSLISEMNRANSYCQGAPQQTANGTSAIAYITRAIATALDKGSNHSYSLSAIVSQMERNNSYCEGADQQSANYLYRTMDMLAVIADLFMDEMEKRTAKYWEEHREEKRQLLEEKQMLQSQITQIRAEANQVNDGGKSAPIRAEISRLKAKRDVIGRDDLAAIRMELDSARRDHDAIGFFKFAEKKAAKERIAEIQAQMEKKEQMFAREKAGVDIVIKEKEQQIAKIDRHTAARKNEILNRCDPLNWRIEQINEELTRQR